MRQSGTVHSIQMLRFIAATTVVLFHAQLSFANALWFRQDKFDAYLFGLGKSGVHIFFVISGFIMVLTSWQGDKPYDAKQFFKRRLLRIFPIYWLCILIYLGVHAAIGEAYDLTPIQLLGSLFLWPGKAAYVIGPAWTLSYEMYFYICFGFAMMLGLTRGLVVLGLTFLGLIVLGRFLPHKPPILSVMTNQLLLEFLAGAAIGWLAHKGRLPLGWGPYITLAGGALFFASYLYGYDSLPSVVSFGVPSAVLILGAVTWETARGASPVVKRLGKLGDSSYVLYLIHILVITVGLTISQSLPREIVPPPVIAAFLIAIVSIVLAELIHRRIERPMLGMLKSMRGQVSLRSA